MTQHSEPHPSGPDRPDDLPGDERIGRMREHVLTEVDADVRRRGRRTRRVLAGAAVVCVVAVGGVGFAGLVAPTGGDSSASSSAEIAPVPSGDRSDASGGSVQDQAGSLGDSVPEPATGTDTDGSSPSEVVDPDRDVVTTGSISVTVDDPAAAADRLAAWLATVDGRVDARSEVDDPGLDDSGLDGSGLDDSGPDGSGAGYASLTVRVPADHVEAMIERLREYGDVGSVDLAREDVTTQRVDLDARIESLSISVQRLQDILADADTAKDLLAVESSLSKRQAELSSLEAQRKALGEQVALSTLEVSLSSAERAETPDPGGFLGGLRDGWNALVSTMDAVVVALGVTLPWLVAVAVLAGAWVVVRRARTCGVRR